MAKTTRGRLRRLWFNVHLWIGVGLSALLIPLGLTGAALVWGDAIDRAGPGRAIHGPPAVARPPSAYLAAAQGALAGTARPSALRFPTRAGDPVAVVARGRPAAGGTGREGGRAPPVTVWLNPSDAAVLSVSHGRPGWWRMAHGFHETLLQPGWGRSAVGALGVAMLASSLTGIWLWWPRSGALTRALRFRRTPGWWLNLHHMAGFWISLPLAFVSLTGIGLGFPQATRGLIGAFAPVSASPQRGLEGDAPSPGPGAPDASGSHRRHRRGEGGRGDGGGSGNAGGGGGGGSPALDADAAAARSGVPLAAIRTLTLPSRGRPAWTVEPATGPAVEVPADGSAPRPAPAPLGGDVAWRWVHRLHGATDLPLAWKLIVTLCGLAPTLLGLTGVAVWASKALRRRRGSGPAPAPADA